MTGEYILSIITASVALLAATGAQILAHILTSKRAKKERERTIYQEFIFPFFSKVLLFYDTETHYRKGHDVEKEIDVYDLVDSIAEKVRFGNLKLLSCFYEIEKTDYFFDGRGGTKERNVLRFLFWYLDNSYLVINNMIDIEEDIQKKMLAEIKKTQKLYGIWILISEEYHFTYSEDVIDFMRHDFYYLDLLPEFDLVLIKELVETEVAVDRRRLDFLSIIVQHISKQEEGLSLVSIFNGHFSYSKEHNLKEGE